MNEPRWGRDEASPPVDQLRELSIRLSEHIEAYRLYDWQPDVNWINNTNEQVIERMKLGSLPCGESKTSADCWQG